MKYKYRAPGVVYVDDNYYVPAAKYTPSTIKTLKLLVNNILNDGKINFISKKGEITINGVNIDIVNTIGIVGEGNIDVYGDDSTDTVTISSPTIESGDGISVTLNQGKLIISATKSGNIGTKEVDETDMGENKILKYNGEKFVYVPIPNWLYKTNEDGSIDVSGVLDGGDF